MRDAARLLLLEATALRPILEGLSPQEFATETVCTGWSVRDVLAHCSAALTRTAYGDIHGFTPEENQADVERRRSWSVGDVLEELFETYEKAAKAVDAADGRLDGVGLGEWIHGGDIREAVGQPDAYVSAGVELAVPLLVVRSRAPGRPRFDAHVEVDGSVEIYRLGDPDAEGVIGRLDCDLAGFVRLCGGRSYERSTFVLEGVKPEDLSLFS